MRFRKGRFTEPARRVFFSPRIPPNQSARHRGRRALLAPFYVRRAWDQSANQPGPHRYGPRVHLSLQPRRSDAPLTRLLAIRCQFSLTFYELDISFPTVTEAILLKVLEAQDNLAPPALNFHLCALSFQLMNHPLKYPILAS